MIVHRSGIIRCYQLALVNGLWGDRYTRVYIYMRQAFTAAVCHEPNARFMFRQNTLFPI